MSSRILVAEDDDQTRGLLEKVLQLPGWEVHAVANGAEAVNAWQSGHYDLVLLDLGMPEMDGMEVARAIRAKEHEGRRIPIIIYSAYVLHDRSQDFLADAGVDEYLPKPVRLPTLYAAISRYIEDRGGAGGRAEPS